MGEFIQDPQFGEIVDFEYLRVPLHEAYDAMHPDFNMMEAINIGTKHFWSDLMVFSSWPR